MGENKKNTGAVYLSKSARFSRFGTEKKKSPLEEEVPKENNKYFKK